MDQLVLRRGEGRLLSPSTVLLILSTTSCHSPDLGIPPSCQSHPLRKTLRLRGIEQRRAETEDASNAGDRRLADQSQLGVGDVICDGVIFPDTIFTPPASCGVCTNVVQILDSISTPSFLSVFIPFSLLFATSRHLAIPFHSTPPLLLLYITHRVCHL